MRAVTETLQAHWYRYDEIFERERRMIWSIGYSNAAVDLRLQLEESVGEDGTEPQSLVDVLSHW
jgi:hypothetical protein